MKYPRFIRVIRKRYRMLTGYSPPVKAKKKVKQVAPNKSKTVASSPVKAKKAVKKVASKTTKTAAMSSQKPKEPLPQKRKELSESEMIKQFLLKHTKSLIVSKKLSFNIEVAVYFDGNIANIYQIQQWVRAFGLLHVKHPLVILARHKPVYDWIVENTEVPVVYLRTIDDLQSFYEENTSIKCILYVNHAFKNFQSLINNNAMHVHINHGESDKTSTTTNQVKAYDRVFIVADAAYNKFANNLLDADMSSFVKIGRPQLDGVKKLERPSVCDDVDNDSNGKDITPMMKEPLKVVLYAPTWEGTHKSMDFSSIREFGEQIVDAVLANPNYYLIYRPHPRTGSRDLEVGKLDKKIRTKVKKEKLAHMDIESDSLSLCDLCDIAIFDNSAVGIDYLKYNKPFLLSDLFVNQEGARADKPIFNKAAKLINEDTIDQVGVILEQELSFDSMREEREHVRNMFIGDYEEGESTQKFINEVTNVIHRRDALVSARTAAQDL